MQLAFCNNTFIDRINYMIHNSGSLFKCLRGLQDRKVLQKRTGFKTTILKSDRYPTDVVETPS